MKYLPEIIYGGVDGIITTFAIISGSMGANMAMRIPVIIGLSSLVADGFSMGVSSYLAEDVREEKKNPIFVALATFVSFIIIGSVPILPFILTIPNPFMYSGILMCVSLFLTGLLKNLQHGFTTLLLGITAALISFYIGDNLKKLKLK